MDASSRLASGAGWSQVRSRDGPEVPLTPGSYCRTPPAGCGLCLHRSIPGDGVSAWNLVGVRQIFVDVYVPGGQWNESGEGGGLPTSSPSVSTIPQHCGSKGCRSRPLARPQEDRPRRAPLPSAAVQQPPGVPAETATSSTSFLFLPRGKSRLHGGPALGPLGGFLVPSQGR